MNPFKWIKITSVGLFSLFNIYSACLAQKVTKVDTIWIKNDNLKLTLARSVFSIVDDHLMAVNYNYNLIGRINFSTGQQTFLDCNALFKDFDIQYQKTPSIPGSDSANQSSVYESDYRGDLQAVSFLDANRALLLYIYPFSNTSSDGRRNEYPLLKKFVLLDVNITTGQSTGYLVDDVDPNFIIPTYTGAMNANLINNEVYITVREQAISDTANIRNYGVFEFDSLHHKMRWKRVASTRMDSRFLRTGTGFNFSQTTILPYRDKMYYVYHYTNAIRSIEDNSLLFTLPLENYSDNYEFAVEKANCIPTWLYQVSSANDRIQIIAGIKNEPQCKVRLKYYEFMNGKIVKSLPYTLPLVTPFAIQGETLVEGYTPETGNGYLLKKQVVY